MSSSISSLYSTSSSSSSSSSTTQLDQLVESYRQTQQSKIDAVTTKQTNLEAKRTFVSALNTRISSLISAMDKLGSFSSGGTSGIFTKSSTIDTKFQARSATSSDKSILTATAKEGAYVSSNSVFVERLAARDSLVSNQMSLSGAFGETGTQTFSLKSNSKTYNISVTFDGTETNQQAINKIALAINSAKDPDDSTKSIGISASLIKDTSTTGRLTISPTDTGADYRVSFTDSPALAKLGITTSGLNSETTSRVVATDTTAGYMKADYTELNSKVKINGISIFRNSNTIDDAIENVSLALSKAQASTEQPVTVTTAIDSSSVESLIKPVLSAYNDIVTYVNNNKTIKREESFVSSLSSQLRSLLTQGLAGTAEGEPKYLMDVGIKVSDSGTISISDSTMLSDALKKNAQKVANLFTASDGLIARLNSAVQNLTGESGLLTSRTKTLNQQISNTANQKEKVQERIDQQAEAMRNQYQSLLKSYYEAQNQYQWFTSSSTTTTS